MLGIENTVLYSEAKRLLALATLVAAAVFPLQAESLCFLLQKSAAKAPVQFLDAQQVCYGKVLCHGKAYI